MSLRLRFTVLAAAVTALVVSVVGGGLYVAFAHQQQDTLDSRLRESARVIHNARPQGLRPEPTTAPGSAPTVRVPRGRGPVFVLALDSGGKVVFRSDTAPESGIGIPAAVRQAVLTQGDQLLTVSSGGQDYRLDVTTAPGDAASQAQLVAVGESLGTVDDALRPLRYMLLAAFGISLLLGAGAGFVVARRALRPVTRLSVAAEQIGAGPDLSVRLPQPEGDDEVSHLTHAFNASLDRIEVTYRELEQLLDRQRRFVADASHELRTPLTSVRADIAMLRRYPEMPGDEREALVERCTHEVERIARLAADLLDQARADAGVVHVAAVDWDAVAHDLVAELTRLAAPRRVSAELSPLGPGASDADALHRITRILGENLARHTPASAAVRVVARSAGDDVLLRVEDDGPGVDPRLLSAIFDRFVRADPARSGPGTGLGLAIARGLAAALGGSVTASPGERGGLAVELRLPRVSEGAAGAAVPGPVVSGSGTG